MRVFRPDMLRPGDGLHPLHCAKSKKVFTSLLLGQPLHCFQVGTTRPALLYM